MTMACHICRLYKGNRLGFMLDFQENFHVDLCLCRYAYSVAISSHCGSSRSGPFPPSAGAGAPGDQKWRLGDDVKVAMALG